VIAALPQIDIKLESYAILAAQRGGKKGIDE
jgi:hypothetical protein